jgi:hypothetical protein
MVGWVGKSGRPESDWFYIHMVVGTQFMNDHPDAFKNQKLLPPALLTVAAKMKVGPRL